MLAEIRIGTGKLKLKGIIKDVSRNCRVRAGKIHRVPHLTVYYLRPLNASQIHTIKSIIEKLSRNYQNLGYTVDGFKSMRGDKGSVIYFNVLPNKALSGFVRELRSHFREISPPIKSFDRSDDLVFHITLAYKLNDYGSRLIWSYLNKRDEYGKALSDLYLSLPVTRVTLLSNTARIVYEYDFYQRRFLQRNEALSKYEWGRTLHAMRINLGAQIENVPPSRQASVYLLSDLHLGHANIIRYCLRPFINVNEMDAVLVKNWNNTVSDADTVFYCGDITHGRGQDPDFWIGKLKGNIIYARGNHDDEIPLHSVPTFVTKELDYRGYRFLLVHNPKDVPRDYRGWVIHGHIHNNDLRNYPFINGEKKTINVCAELINYAPLDIDKLLALDINSIKRMDTLNSEPLRYQTEEKHYVEQRDRMTTYTGEKKSGVTVKRDDKGSFEFIARVNDDNTVPEDIANKLKPYLNGYTPNKNIHYHLYGGTMFFGATKECGAFVCIYCEAGKMPLRTVMINGIRMQDYRQVIGESDRQQKIAAQKVYIQNKRNESLFGWVRNLFG